MSDGNFGAFISRERERLNAERQQISNQQEELRRKLDAINREFAAIEAYETAKSGRAASARGGSRAGTQRGRRGSKRAELMKVIRAGNGMSRRDILEKMRLRGDKAGEMSVSNALTALKKAGQISSEGGRYRAG